MVSCCGYSLKSFNKIALFLYILAFIVFFSPTAKSQPTCPTDTLYGISWSQGQCTCVADTVGKATPFAEDTIGSINGWIDERDLTCDPKSKQWIPNKTLKYAKCEGCTKTFNACCGPAHLGKFKSTPIVGLCGAGTQTKVTLINGKYTWHCKGVGGGGDSICEGYRK